MTLLLRCDYYLCRKEFEIEVYIGGAPAYPDWDYNALGEFCSDACTAGQVALKEEQAAMKQEREQ